MFKFVDALKSQCTHTHIIYILFSIKIYFGSSCHIDKKKYYEINIKLEKIKYEKKINQKNHGTECGCSCFSKCFLLEKISK